MAGLRWHILPVSGCPPARAYHSACAHRGELVIFGGEARARRLQDTWVLDPTSHTWRQIPVDFPEGRAHAACAVAQERTLLVSGGSRHRGAPAFRADTEPCNDLWMLDLWDPTACGWMRLKRLCRPLCLTAQANVLHSGATVIVFGGHDNTLTDHFDDPIGGFKGLAETMVMRFDCNSRVASMRLCDTGWVNDAIDLSWTLVAFQEQGLAVACKATPNRRMTATVLKFDNLEAHGTETPPIRATSSAMNSGEDNEQSQVPEEVTEEVGDEEEEEDGDDEDDEEQDNDGEDDDEVNAGSE